MFSKWNSQLIKTDIKNKLISIIQFNEILLLGLNLTMYIKIISIPPKIKRIIINEIKENWENK